MSDGSHEDALYQDQELYAREICYIHVNSDQWFYEMKYYLTHGTTPDYLDPKKKRALRLKSSQYHIIQGIICRKNYDGVFLRCLEKRDVERVLSKLHDGPWLVEITLETPLLTKSSELDTTGPLYSRTLMHMQGNASSSKCHRERKKRSLPPTTCDHRMPLSTVGVGHDQGNQSQLFPTAQIHLDNYRLFHQMERKIPLKDINENQVTSFLESHIITRFGIPDSLVFDNAKHFLLLN
jgi:hypothetical protein